MFLLLLAHAHANSGVGEQQWDFHVPPRDDAPTDGILLFDATFLPTATVTEGPGAPFEIEALELMGYMSGNESVVQYRPDEGWETGGAYVVEVPIQGWDEDDVPAEIAFTVGTEPAAPPSAPVLVRSEAEPWSEPDMYHWGCCKPSRKVSFVVESTSDDPWAYVELKGLFEGESQITQNPVLQRLDIGIGPGTHTLSYMQWDDGLGGGLQPPAFEIIGVSASGERSEAQTVAISACGCASAGGGSGAAGLGALALLLVRRRRA